VQSTQQQPSGRQDADEVIVVASPDLANLRNTKNLIDNVKGARLNDAPSRLVLNGVGMLKRPEIASAEFAKAVETDPTAIISHDAKLFGAAANNGQMIAEIEPNGKTAQVFADLASALAGRTDVRTQARRSRAADRQTRSQAAMTGFPMARAFSAERSHTRKGI